MNLKELKTRAQNIVSDIDLVNRDDGITFPDLNNAYNLIVDLAINYNESNNGEHDEQQNKYNRK